MLVQLAQILQENTRKTDTVGRWGGEEFIIIAPDTDLDQCRILGDKIRAEVQNHDFGAVGHVTISLGAAKYHESDTIAHFIINADEALYRAKEGGRNRLETHNS